MIPSRRFRIIPKHKEVVIHDDEPSWITFYPDGSIGVSIHGKVKQPSYQVTSVTHKGKKYPAHEDSEGVIVLETEQGIKKEKI